MGKLNFGSVFPSTLVASGGGGIARMSFLLSRRLVGPLVVDVVIPGCWWDTTQARKEERSNSIRGPWDVSQAVEVNEE